MAWQKSPLAMVIASLLIFLVLGLIPLWYLSNACKPNPTEQPQVGAQDASKGGKPSARKPSVLKLLESIHETQKAQYEADRREKQEKSWWHSFGCEMKVTDFLIAMFTLGLVVVGTWQGLHLKRTVESAEDAINKIERPYLFVYGAERFSTDASVVVGFTPFVSYAVANYGKLPAVIADVLAEVSSSDSGDPQLPMLADDDHPLRVRAVLSSNDIEPRCIARVPDGLQTYSSQGGEVIVDPAEEGGDIFLWIVVRYRGPFTSGHETSACWRLDRMTNRFVQHGGDQYNYTK